MRLWERLFGRSASQSYSALERINCPKQNTEKNTPDRARVFKRFNYVFRKKSLVA